MPPSQPRDESMASAVPPMFDAFAPHFQDLTRPTRRGLAGAPGRTKHFRLRGLTAADPHSLSAKRCAIFPFTASPPYHNLPKLARAILCFFTRPARRVLCFPQRGKLSWPISREDMTDEGEGWLRTTGPAFASYSSVRGPFAPPILSFSFLEKERMRRARWKKGKERKQERHLILASPSAEGFASLAPLRG